ncbi:unnamed protein product [Trichogramma brassicae]|uniref:Uncharacterized protein n=1 Tax=Trichogramma brassicae TaxID=86971 RepID=A0A6H5IQS2_9HYME|nr:unnamed protein product [Trichogramma brassicae]
MLVNLALPFVHKMTLRHSNLFNKKNIHEDNEIQDMEKLRLYPNHVVFFDGRKYYDQYMQVPVYVPDVPNPNIVSKPHYPKDLVYANNVDLSLEQIRAQKYLQSQEHQNSSYGSHSLTQNPYHYSMQQHMQQQQQQHHSHHVSPSSSHQMMQPQPHQPQQPPQHHQMPHHLHEAPPHAMHHQHQSPVQSHYPHHYPPAVQPMPPSHHGISHMQHQMMHSPHHSHMPHQHTQQAVLQSPHHQHQQHVQPQHHMYNSPVPNNMNYGQPYASPMQPPYPSHDQAKQVQYPGYPEHQHPQEQKPPSYRMPIELPHIKSPGMNRRDIEYLQNADNKENNATVGLEDSSIKQQPPQTDENNLYIDESLGIAPLPGVNETCYTETFNRPLIASTPMTHNFKTYKSPRDMPPQHHPHQQLHHQQAAQQYHQQQHQQQQQPQHALPQHQQHYYDSQPVAPQPPLPPPAQAMPPPELGEKLSVIMETTREYVSNSSTSSGTPSVGSTIKEQPIVAVHLRCHQAIHASGLVDLVLSSLDARQAKCIVHLPNQYNLEYQYTLARDKHFQLDAFLHERPERAREEWKREKQQNGAAMTTTTTTRSSRVKKSLRRCTIVFC